MEIENATIESTFLGVQDHGILTWTVFLKFGSASQGYGGFALDRWDAAAKVNIGLAFGSASIRAVLEAVGVSKWEDLVGKHVRTEGNHGHIVKLGHIVEDRWVNLSEMAREYAGMEDDQE